MAHAEAFCSAGQCVPEGMGPGPNMEIVGEFPGQATAISVQDDFGVQAAEFLPYSKNQDLIGGQTDTIKTSVYRKPDGTALFIVANLSEEKQNATLKVDWDRLKPGRPTLSDAETGRSLQVEGGPLSVEVGPLDYRAILSE